jgi:hypothetical protein
MKKLPLFSMLLALSVTTAIAQECKVLLKPIAGTYEGDCKSGKADGRGKSVGKDNYEGEFRSGVPDGKGVYTWENKDWFEGTWKKGDREGEGTLHITNGGTKDSLLVGFWKKDKYMGRYEKAYKILSQSQTISTVSVTELKDSKLGEIAIILSSVSGGTNTLSSQMKTGTTLPKIKLTSVDVTQRDFNGYSEIPYQPKATKFIVRKVVFPFKAFFRSDTHFVEIAFYEEGNYIVDINVLQ